MHWLFKLKLRAKRCKKLILNKIAHQIVHAMNSNQMKLASSSYFPHVKKILIHLAQLWVHQNPAKLYLWNTPHIWKMLVGPLHEMRNNSYPWCGHFYMLKLRSSITFWKLWLNVSTSLWLISLNQSANLIQWHWIS